MRTASWIVRLSDAELTGGGVGASSPKARGALETTDKLANTTRKRKRNRPGFMRRLQHRPISSGNYEFGADAWLRSLVRGKETRAMRRRDPSPTSLHPHGNDPRREPARVQKKNSPLRGRQSGSNGATYR